jgi:hypothetical protein
MKSPHFQALDRTGRCIQRDRQQAFPGFLNTMEPTAPGKVITSSSTTTAVTSTQVLCWLPCHSTSV